MSRHGAGRASRAQPPPLAARPLCPVVSWPLLLGRRFVVSEILAKMMPPPKLRSWRQGEPDRLLRAPVAPQYFDEYLLIRQSMKVALGEPSAMRDQERRDAATLAQIE